MNETIPLKSAVSIVLVEPQSPGNIGMVCRAMMNMGLTDLRLVNPCRVDHPEALKFAVSAARCPPGVRGPDRERSESSPWPSDGSGKGPGRYQADRFDLA